MAVAGSAMETRPKMVEAAPARAVWGGTRAAIGAIAARKTTESAATNQNAGRVLTATSMRSPPGVSKRNGPHKSAAPQRSSAEAARPTVFATGWPVFSAIR